MFFIAFKTIQDVYRLSIGADTRLELANSTLTKKIIQTPIDTIK